MVVSSERSYPLEMEKILIWCALALAALNAWGDTRRPLWSPAEAGQDLTMIAVPDPVTQGLRLSPVQAEQLRFMERVDELIKRLNLHLENVGYASTMPREQEFRLYQSQKPGFGAIRF